MRNLAATWYTDPMVFARERAAIFSRTWQYAGPASRVSVPGSYVTVDIAGSGVIILRGRDGELRALRNVCRHRGATLLNEPSGSCATIRCPYHHWVFDDRGRLIATPHFGDDATFVMDDWPLDPVHLDEWRGLLFVALDPTESLLAQLGDLPAELADEPIETYVAQATARVEFDANWKIYTDNFVEGYHIPGIHPDFHAAIEFGRFETTAHPGYVRMSAPPRAGLFYRGVWLWMWPNWTLSLFEGGMNTSRINPTAVDRTEQLYDFHFADTSVVGEAARADTVERNIAVVHQDVGVCADIHRNHLAGGYRPGPLSPRHEQGVAYFQGRVAQAVGDDAVQA
jgi:choline monooxygenase